MSVPAKANIEITMKVDNWAFGKVTGFEKGAKKEEKTAALR